MILDSLYNFDGGYNAAKLAMALATEPPTAIFGGSDEAALGALYALQEMESEGTGSSSRSAGLMTYLRHSRSGLDLSTVVHPVDEIVERAITMLITILAGHASLNPASSFSLPGW